MAADPEILKRLDRIQAMLKIAFATQLKEASDAVRADPVSAAILDSSEQWISSTDLQEKVAKKVGMSTRRVRDRFPELVANGSLDTRGTERRIEYQATGLI